MRFGDIPSNTEIAHALDMTPIVLPDKVAGLPDIIKAVEALVANQNAILTLLQSAGFLAAPHLRKP